MTARRGDNLMRGGRTVRRRPHKPEYLGANPSPATSFAGANHQGDTPERRREDLGGWNGRRGLEREKDLDPLGIKTATESFFRAFPGDPKEQPCLRCGHIADGHIHLEPSYPIKHRRVAAP